MPRPFIHPIARREFLASCGLGLGLGDIALRGLLADERHQAEDEALPAPHHPPRAKAVIQLFMAGGPSQLELFEPKPRLQELHGQAVPESLLEGKRFAFLKPDASLLATQRKFQRWGECGAAVSELLPHIGGMADDLTFVRTMHTDNFNHGPAKLLTQTGYQTFGHPTLGAWLLYGLGSVSRELPGFVVLQSGPRGPRGGSYLWSNGFLPSELQGVPLRSQGDPILNLTSPPDVAATSQQRVVEAIARLNRLRAADTLSQDTLARTANYEMAFRMQTSAPELIDVSDESQTTLDAYGVERGQPSFAYNCLLARRLVERGVRCVTLFHTNWDHHGGAENLEGELEKVTREVDQSSAALVQDLKQRGMLDDTLVVWGGEFGRTPMGETRSPVGRDHHIDAYTIWLAGGGTRPGTLFGETDELGFYPREDSQRVHVHDLHATILHLLGLDHLRLTYRFQGRDFRLTDVAGEIVKDILS